MKYMIHSCNQREWYVDEFLIPSMLKQGIKETDIYKHNDTKCEGNLVSWVKSCRLAYQMWGEQNVWHLQDDVLICSTFKEQTEQLESREGLICGFTTFYDDGREPGEGTVINDMWYSFPCIRIPAKLGNDFADWVDIWVWRDNQYGKWVRDKKGDDFIFRVWVENYHTNDTVLNVAPNLVEHVDYLIGGTVINKQRIKDSVRSSYWEEQYLVDELEKELKRR